MPSRIDIGPEGGPFVELDEQTGELVIRVPNDEIDLTGANVSNAANLATDPHDNTQHSVDFAEDPHDNTQHSETFLFDGQSFDGLDTSELLNLLRVSTQSLENQDYTEAVATASNASGTITIDLAAANLHRVEAVDNVTIEFANVTTTPPGNSVTIYFEDADGTGPHTISWPTSVAWSDGNVQDEIEANDNIEIGLISDDGGTEFRARRSGRRFA